MPNPFRLGALLIPNTPWDEMLRRCRTVEELGLDAVWIDDHIANPQRLDQPWFDAWSTLAAFGQATTTISIGPLVSNPVLRHPALLARHALTTDHVSNGRLVLGVGSGYAETDHRIVQVPQWSGRERADRFAEAVAAIDQLLRGQRAPAGRYVDTGDLVLAPTSPQRPRPPLYVAAHGDQALDVAARHADGWVSFGGWGLSAVELFDATRRRGDHLAERCEALGRDATSVRRILLAGSAAVCDEPMWSSVDAFEDFVGRARAAGIDELAVYYPPESVSRTASAGVFERVVAEVLPRLRRA